MGESRIGDFPWGYSNILGGVRISIHARLFRPTNFINVSTTAAAATDVDGTKIEQGKSGGFREPFPPCALRSGGASRM